MNSKTQKAQRRPVEMLKGSMAKQMLIFSMPLVFSNILQALFNISDIAVIGQFAGQDSLGAVGSTTILIYFFVGFLMGMGGGVNVLTAKYLGAGNREKTRKTVHTALFVCLGLGFGIIAICLPLARVMLLLLKTKEELLEKAVLYFRLYMLGAPALAIYNYGNAVYSARGDTRTPLIVLSASGVLNVALNLFFVIVLKMDVAGVAVASIISQYLSSFTLLFLLSGRRDELALRPKEICFDFPCAWELLKLGIPAGFQNSIFAIANLFIQTGVNSFDVLTVDGNTAAANYDGLVYDIMAAFYMAGASFIGQNYGAGKKKRIKQAYLLCLGYSFGFAFAIGACLSVFGSVFLRVFTSDPAVIQAGLPRIRIMGLSYAFSAFMDGSIAASRGLGKTALPSVFVILGSCVFRVAWVYTVFAYFHTIQSLYLLYIFSWTLTAIAEVWYFLHTYRRLDFNLTEEENP